MTAPIRSPEARQREHELHRALSAARTLHERLEMLGDRAADVAIVRSLRDSPWHNAMRVP